MTEQKWINPTNQKRTSERFLIEVVENHLRRITGRIKHHRSWVADNYLWTFRTGVILAVTAISLISFGLAGMVDPFWIVPSILVWGNVLWCFYPATPDNAWDRCMCDEHAPGKLR